MSLQATPAASVASTGSTASSNSAAGNGASSGSAASVSVLFEKDKIWYFSNEQLANSPSRRCGIKADEELHYRQMTSFLIQEMGQRLQVSQLCINTAIVYMHRFYAFHSFTHFHRNSMASASLFLAAKVEEQPRKLEHVIRAANKCLAQTTDQNYADLAQELVFNENVLLQTLGFDVAIDHPHTHVVRTCQLVKACKDLAQTSYFLASNSLHLTSMCLQYRPTVVACFCIYLACKWSRWEIPQSTEGKHWFYYVDKSVSLELLKQLTDEFIAIYEKSPARLKSKLNSIRAIAQGSSNRTAANSKDNKPKEDWKMSEMMKGYHSNINAPPELMNGNDGRELTSQQTAALLPPPAMVPQQRRGGDHGHQQRSSVSGTSANSSSSNHKLQNYAGPISADHTDHKSKQSGYNNRAPSNHQSSSSSAQRSSGNSSSLSTSSSSSIQRSSSSSQQTRPTMPMDYQKSSRSMPPVGMPPHGAHKIPTNTKQPPLLDTRSSSSAAAGLVNSKDAVKSSSSSSKIYPNVPPAYGNNAPNSLMRGSFMSGSSGASNGGPPNAAYHGHRSKSNSSTSSSSVHNMPSNYEQTLPGFAQNSSNQQALQQQQHVPSYNSHLQLDTSSAVPQNSNNQTQQQQQQIKNNSLFSPEWSDIKKEPNSHFNGLLPPPTHESLGFKLNNHVRDKDSPKKERLSTGGTPTKKEKHRSAALQMPMGASSTALNSSHGLKAMLPPNKKLNAELMAAPNLPELAGTSRDGSNALKRANETSSSQYGLNKLDEDSLPRDKLRKLDNSGLPGYSFTSGSSQEHDKHAPPTLSISNGIETTPDLVRSLLKESLCTTKASLLMPEPLTMPGLKPPAELLEPMPSMVIKKEPTLPSSLALTTATITAPTNIMGMPMDTFTKLDEIKEENVSSKSEKKKKKDKHKHKEKDKSKDKSDKEERKKHKKDKQKDRAKDTSGMGNTDSLKLVIKTNTAAGNANGLLSITHTTASDAPAAPLKLKISKNKMEPNNYSTAQSTSTAAAAAPAAAFGQPATSMATTGNLGMNAAYGGYATSMASSSNKKKDRERDKEKRKDKNADYAKYNGMVGVTQAPSVAGMLATPTTMSSGMLNTMAPSSALPVYTKK